MPYFQAGQGSCVWMKCSRPAWCAKEKGQGEATGEMEDRNAPLGSLGACESFCRCTSNSGQGRGRGVGWWENGKLILRQGELWNLIMLSNCRRLRNPCTTWEIWHQRRTEVMWSWLEGPPPARARALYLLSACPYHYSSNATQGRDTFVLALEAIRCLGQWGIDSETGGTCRCRPDLKAAAPRNRGN